MSSRQEKKQMAIVAAELGYSALREFNHSDLWLNEIYRYSSTCNHSFRDCLTLRRHWEKVTCNPHLQLSQESHGHMMKIWANVCHRVFMTVARSLDHGILICDLPSWGK